MEIKYTAQRIADTENGWLITDNETQKQDIVFCRLNENTAEDAVKVLEESKMPQEDEALKGETL